MGGWLPCSKCCVAHIIAQIDADEAPMSLQGQPSGHGATAPASSLLPRISAAGEGSRRTSANGTGRVSSSGGVAGEDMAPYKRTFTKTSMQVRILP